MQDLEYWGRRFNELFPDGPTQEQVDEAHRWFAQQRDENDRIRREYEATKERSENFEQTCR